MKLLIWLYRFIFCRKLFYTLNLRIFDLCLRGIGVLNYEGYTVTGERWFIEEFLKDKDVKTIIDVGANTDPYGVELQDVNVYALEPNQATFKKLQSSVKRNPHIHCFQIGLSNKAGTATLYDISKDGTSLATLQGETLSKQYGKKMIKTKVMLKTLDQFMKENSLESIDLLKIDTEGNEYKVLLGAKKALQRKHIKMILFEFNEMNAYNNVFMRDFYELLDGFDFFRLLPDGLAPMGKYRPITHELFAFQNIVAIRR